MRENVTSISYASMCIACRGVFVARYLIVCLLIAGCGQSASSPKPAADATLQPANGSAPVKVVAEAKEPPGPDLKDVAPDDIFEVGELTANFEVGATGSASAASGEVVLATAPDATFSQQLLAAAPALTTQPEASTVRLPTGFTPIEPLHVSGLPGRIRCDVDGSELVLIPAGNGALGSQDGPPETRPYIVLGQDAFYMGVNEITIAQVKAIRLKFAKANIGEPLNAAADSNQPAVGLTWIEARAYAKAVGADLPTEVQWEKAARGELGFPFPWGKSRPLWTSPRTPEQIDAVGSHSDDRSQFGVFDLAGNAREWTLDFYHPEAFAALLPLSPERRKNWTGPRSTPDGLRVVKGNGPDWKVWARRGVKMSERDAHLGFRCVLNLASK